MNQSTLNEMLGIAKADILRGSSVNIPDVNISGEFSSGGNNTTKRRSH